MRTTPALALLLACCANAGAQTPQATQPATSADATRPRLFIAGFEASGDARDAWIPVAIEETLAWRLRRAADIGVVPVVRAYQARLELADLNSAPPEWSVVAARLGADVLLTGRCTGPPEAIQLELTFAWLDGRTAPAVFRPPPARPFEVLDVATRWTLDTAAGRPTAPTRPLTLAPPAASPAALEYYAKAVLSLRAGQAGEARVQAREAIDFDPRFRPAIGLLAELELHFGAGDAGETLALLRLLAALARGADDPHERADTELALGSLDALRGADTASIVRFETALAAFHELGDAYGQLAAMSQIVDWRLRCSESAPPELGPAALAEFRRRHIAAAAEWQALILAEAERLGDSLAAAPAANKLALLYERCGNAPAAGSLHEYALEAARRSGSRANEATAWLFLGRWQQQHGSPDQAEAALRRCLELAAPEARPIVRSTLAGVLKSQGRKGDALAAYQLALTELGTDGDLGLQLALLREIAPLQHELGQHSAAITALQQARDVAAALRHVDLAEIETRLREWKTEATPR